MRENESRVSKTLPEGPTLNPEYNGVLAQWNREGHPSLPECEQCGCDLTGKQVCETHFGWYCDGCVDAIEASDYYSEEAAQRAERQQMGITS